MCEWTQNQVTRLIELYKNLEPLWNPRDADYKKRSVKDDSYQSLLEQLKDIVPDLNVDSIKKKIHTIRSQYLRERKCMRESLTNGEGTCTVPYKPKLWCYNLLSFLNETITSREINRNPSQSPRSTVDSTYDSQFQEDEPFYDDATLSSMEEIYIKPEPFPDYDDSAISCSISTTANNKTSNSVSPLPSIIIKPKPMKKRKLREDSSHQRSTDSDAGSHRRLTDSTINSPTPAVRNDSQIFGDMIGSELQLLSPQQRIFAKKLMNDAVFMAATETLTKNTRILNC